MGAAYHVLATRICSASTRARQRPAGGTAAAATASPETPLAKSLLAITDPRELSSKCVHVCAECCLLARLHVCLWLWGSCLA